MAEPPPGPPPGSPSPSLPWRRIDVEMRDRHARPLPGGDVAFMVDGALAGDARNIDGHASIELPDDDASVAVTARFGPLAPTQVLATTQSGWVFTFPVDRDRRVDVQVRDRRGVPVRGADVVLSADGADTRLVTNADGRASHAIGAPLATVDARASYAGRSAAARLAPAQDAAALALPITYRPDGVAGTVALVAVPLVLIAVSAAFAYVGGMQAHLPVIVGLVLLAVAIGLTFTFSAPTPLQRQIILATFALAGGGIFAEIPGLLDIKLSLGQQTAIGAGGAAAAFVILYFFSAAKPPE